MFEKFKYRLLVFIRYLGDSFFYPFFALYLKEQGLVESKIGFILSISPLIGIITNPIYTKICKNTRITKQVLTIVTILEALFITAISFSSNFYLISVLTIFVAIFGSCHYGLLDSLLSIYAQTAKVDYSSIRLFGSFAYIIGTSIGGLIAKSYNYQVCFIIASIFFIISGVLYFIIKPMEYEETKEKSNYKVLFKNKSYLIFVIFIVILLGTLNAGDHFFSVYLESRSIASNQYGMIYSYYVIIEVVLLFIFSKLSNKLNNNILLIIASICLTLRLFINGMYAPLVIVVIASGLRGVSYAIILHTSFKTITQILGKEKATSGIMFMTLCSSLYLFLFNNVDGFIIEKTQGYQVFYLILAIISLFSLFLSIVNYVYNLNKGKLIKK